MTLDEMKEVNELFNKAIEILKSDTNEETKISDFDLKTLQSIQMRLANKYKRFIRNELKAEISKRTIDL